MSSPEAFFDTLYIIESVQEPLGGLSRLEVQRCSYLACLLALYAGCPVAEWGYRFARTDYGTPFSDAINQALDRLTDGAQLATSNQRFTVAKSGLAQLSQLNNLQVMAARIKFLDAATASLISVSPATFSESIENEPTVKRALLRENGGGLLDGPALEVVYRQFEMIHSALGGKTPDLFVPSMLWLTYLSDQPVTRRIEVSGS